MSDLLKKTVKLAHANPELRGKLLPLIHQAGADKVARRGEGELLFANDKVRVRTWGHPEGLLEAQELPQKPVKRRLRKLTVSTGYWAQQFRGYYHSNVFMMENILRDAKLTSSMNIDQVKAAMKKALEKAVKDFLDQEDITEDKLKNWGLDMKRLDRVWWFTEEEVFYLNVEPADYKPIEFAGSDFGGRSQWTEFKFYADSDDDEYMQRMEGMRAFYKSKSAGGARKLFKLLKPDPDRVRRMSLKDFKAMLDKAKIAYDYVPTVWR